MSKLPAEPVHGHIQESDFSCNFIEDRNTCADHEDPSSAHKIALLIKEIEASSGFLPVICTFKLRVIYSRTTLANTINSSQPTLTGYQVAKSVPGHLVIREGRVYAQIGIRYIPAYANLGMSGKLFFIHVRKPNESGSFVKWERRKNYKYTKTGRTKTLESIPVC